MITKPSYSNMFKYNCFVYSPRISQQQTSCTLSFFYWTKSWIHPAQITGQDIQPSSLTLRLLRTFLLHSNSATDCATWWNQINRYQKKNQPYFTVICNHRLGIKPLQQKMTRAKMQAKKRFYVRKKLPHCVFLTFQRIVIANGDRPAVEGELKAAIERSLNAQHASLCPWGLLDSHWARKETDDFEGKRGSIHF